MSLHVERNSMNESKKLILNEVYSAYMKGVER